MVELMIVYKSMPPSSHIQTTAHSIGHYYKYSKKIIKKGWRKNEQNGKKRKKRRIERIMKRISRNTGRDDMLFGNTCFSLSCLSDLSRAWLHHSIKVSLGQIVVWLSAD